MGLAVPAFLLLALVPPGLPPRQVSLKQLDDERVQGVGTRLLLLSLATAVHVGCLDTIEVHEDHHIKQDGHH